jgi:hypothetical protein
MSSFLERLNQMRIELAQRDADPLRDKVEATVRGLKAISSAALLDPLGRKNTAGNRRQIAPTMRLLGFVPIKSRRLEPGGFRGTQTRGWTRPIRELRNWSPTKKPIAASPGVNQRGLI